MADRPFSWRKGRKELFIKNGQGAAAPCPFLVRVSLVRLCKERTNHHIVRQQHAVACHLLGAHHAIAPPFKEGPRREGSVRFHRPRHGGFQPVAQGRGDAPALPVFVDVQPVEVAVPGHIPEPHDAPVGHRHQRGVGAERAVPGVQVRLPVGPGVQLGRGIVPGVHRVHGVIEQRRHLPAVAGAVFTQQHFLQSPTISFI